MPLQKVRQKACEIQELTDKLVGAIQEFDDICAEESSKILLDLKTNNRGYIPTKTEADLLKSKIGYSLELVDETEIDKIYPDPRNTNMYSTARSLAELSAAVNISVGFLERTYLRYKKC